MAETSILTDDKSPFGKKDIVDTYAISNNDNIVDVGNEEFDVIKARAEGNVRDLADERYNTDKTKLNKNQNSNYAKDGGQYRSLNGKDFSNTLRLSREADAYNAQRAPITISLKHDQHPQHIQNEKRHLETEEMREMERNRQLDLNQKQLAQELQAAVNRKDLDTFIYTYDKLTGITLTRAEAGYMLRQFERQGAISNILSNSKEEFSSYLSRFIAADTATALVNIAASGNTALANAIAQFFNAVMPNSNHILTDRQYMYSLNNLVREAAAANHPLSNDDRMTLAHLVQNSMAMQQAQFSNDNIKMFNFSNSNGRLDKNIGKTNEKISELIGK